MGWVQMIWMGMGVDDMGRAGDVAYFFKNS